AAGRISPAAYSGRGQFLVLGVFDEKAKRDVEGGRRQLTAVAFIENSPRPFKRFADRRFLAEVQVAYVRDKLRRAQRKCLRHPHRVADNRGQRLHGREGELQPGNAAMKCWVKLLIFV